MNDVKRRLERTGIAARDPDWKGQALQPEIGPPVSSRNGRRGSRRPAAGSWRGVNSTILPRDGGIRRAQALRGDPNRFAINALGLCISPAHREIVGVAMPVLSFLSFLLPSRGSTRVNADQKTRNRSLSCLEPVLPP